MVWQGIDYYEVLDQTGNQADIKVPWNYPVKNYK